MIKVLLLPGKNYHAQQFLNLVRAHRDVLYVSADTGAVSGEDAVDMLILELKNPEGPCDFGADIVLVGSDVKDVAILPCGCVKKGALAVFDPADVDSCGFISELDLRPVTYGCGERNTVSISSIGDDALLLSVGRDVLDVNGHMIEVQDHVYRGEIVDLPSAVLACTLLLLTEKREEI